MERGKTAARIYGFFPLPFVTFLSGISNYREKKFLRNRL